MASTVTRIWMWTEACARVDQAGALQRTFFRPSDEQSARPSWEPPADIFESATEILITVAMPGVAAERVDVVADASGLAVVAGRRLPDPGATLSIRRLEIPYGRFERRFDLPMERLELVQRTFADGCLTLRLRKSQG